jgi:hypothetical protein
MNIVYQEGSAGIVTIGTYTSTSDPTYDSLTTSPNLTITGFATVGLGTTSAPDNSQMSFELTSDTNLRIKVRGSDGVLRSGNITLS